MDKFHSMYKKIQNAHIFEAAILPSGNAIRAEHSGLRIMMLTVELPIAANVWKQTVQ